MPKKTELLLTQELSKNLKAKIFDLSEVSIKQMCFDLINFYCLKTTLPSSIFIEFIEDSTAYSTHMKNPNVHL